MCTPKLDPLTVDQYIDSTYLDATDAITRFVGAHARLILSSVGDAPIAPDLLPVWRWLRAAAHPVPSTITLEEAAQTLSRHAATVGASRAMIEHVAEAYPSVLLGQRSGLAALFKGAGLPLWDAYFSARNPLYDVHNRLAVDGLRQCWVSSRPTRLLELGAGTGGTSAAIVECLGELPGGGEARVTISDSALSLLRRSTERLGSRGIDYRRLDFDLPFEPQGIEPGSVDLIVATNALHASRHLGETLSRCRHALAPGGRLVVSESLCAVGRQVHQEFVFNLSPGAARVSRGHSRFLSGADWSRTLADAGFDANIAWNHRGPEMALLSIAVPVANNGSA